MTEKKPCARCGADTPTIDNISSTTFWGAVKREEAVITERSVAVLGTHIKQGDTASDMHILRVDEQSSLCDPCWSLLVRFLQGDRPIPAVDHEHFWIPGGRLGTTPGHREGGYPIDRCMECEQTRLALDRH